MSPTKEPAYRRLTVAARHHLVLLLNAHCTRTADGAVYAEDWDDNKVAAEASRLSGEAVDRGNVAYMRQPVYGNLARPKTSDPIEARLADLEERVRRLTENGEEIFAGLGKRLDSIEAAITDPKRDLFQGGAHVNGKH